ncbi:transcriptional regulator [Leptospira interrogans]|nr:transcriptional regulator [Leptospira interrogans]TQE61345.1 transcriptional regulator [Leptospira interrogans]TQE65090.1 transcriptional regulator [Leptospira interrogans]TQE69890.1 transcriptional regulator [Leptospira interrogans]
MKNSAKRSPNSTTLLYRDHNVTTRTHQKVLQRRRNSQKIISNLKSLAFLCEITS